MPRILLAVVFVIVQIGKALNKLKRELVNGFLYFVVLAPVAITGKFIPIRKFNFHAKKSSWVDIEEKEEM